MELVNSAATTVCGSVFIGIFIMLLFDNIMAVVRRALSYLNRDR